MTEKARAYDHLVMKITYQHLASEHFVIMYLYMLSKL